MLKQNDLESARQIVHMIQSGKKWVCFGAGRYFTDFIREYCQNSNLPFPQYVCDNNEKLWGKKVMGIPVMPPSQLKKEDICDCIIAVSMVLPHAILYELHNELEKHYCITVPVSQIETYLYYTEHERDFAKVYSLLHDEKSKSHYREYIRCLAMGICSFPNLYTQNPYWGNDVVPRLLNGDVVVYAGAYDGKHLDRAISNNANIEIHGFEPNLKMKDHLSEKYHDYKNVYIHNYALYDQTAQLCFDNSISLGAMVVDCRKYGKDRPRKLAELDIVHACKLDDALHSKVDLIALDIEGSEPNAIRGAQRIIDEFSPVLAICVYHRIAHYIEIPLLMASLKPDYQFYFRQHSMLAHESVIYGIPGGRKYE